jgi:hypothetical protein
MDASTREQLKSQYPDQKLQPITSDEDGIEIVCIGAPPSVWLKYQSMGRNFADPIKAAEADELLVLGSMVYPDKDKFRIELERRHLTGFYRAAAPFVAKLTGARETVRLGEVF